MKMLLWMLCGTLLLSKCQSGQELIPETESENLAFYQGADLSYVNEMRDCGALYFDRNGNEKNPYVIFSEAGTHLVRVRLWHNPGWTDYSDLDDVIETIRQSHAQGMDVLLDFHYSDTWADPAHQEIPSAWHAVIDNTEALADSVYNYTYHSLAVLAEKNLLPEIVQVGNEINSEILREKGSAPASINWERNARLINRGLRAVRDASSTFGKPIETMLHIAQPENAVWWFREASDAQVLDYDWIGLSYYPLWSNVALDQLPEYLSKLRTDYGKKLMIVETAYPFTLSNNDSANNILDENAALEQFGISPQGQLDYLLALEEQIMLGGGEGLIYWEPAWVSTPCHTLWGQGSHWDNATLFGHNNQATIAMNYYRS